MASRGPGVLVARSVGYSASLSGVFLPSLPLSFPSSLSVFLCWRRRFVGHRVQWAWCLHVAGSGCQLPPSPLSCPPARGSRQFLCCQPADVLQQRAFLSLGLLTRCKRINIKGRVGAASSWLSGVRAVCAQSLPVVSSEELMCWFSAFQLHQVPCSLHFNQM